MKEDPIAAAEPLPHTWLASEGHEDVAFPWERLVLVCSACRGGKHGPDGAELRKRFKKRLGKPKSLRVAEVSCMKLCPDDGLAVLEVDTRQGAAGARLGVVRDEADCEAMLTRFAQG